MDNLIHIGDVISEQPNYNFENMSEINNSNSEQHNIIDKLESFLSNYYELTNIDLDIINNNKISSELIIFLHMKLNFDVNNNDKIKIIINHFIDHIDNNLYKTSDYIDLQLDLIKILYLYMVKKYGFFSEDPNYDTIIQTYKYESDNIITDDIFLKLSNIIKWNDFLYSYFLKLILHLDNIDAFKYIYEKSLSDGYSIDLIDIIKFIHLHNNRKAYKMLEYKLSVYGTIKFLRIFKYILDMIPDKYQRIKIVEEFYNNIMHSNHSYTSFNELCIDENIDYIVIHNNPDDNLSSYLIYKYFNYNEIKHLAHPIIKSIIKSGINNDILLKDAVIFFKEDINNFASDLYKRSKYNASVLIDYKEIVKSNDRLYKTLLEISTVHIWSLHNHYTSTKWKYLYKFIKNITKYNYVQILSDYQITMILFTAIKYHNLIIINCLFKYYYYNNQSYIKNLLKYITDTNIIKLVIKLMLKNGTFNFNDEDMIYIYLKNTKLLLFLLRRKMINTNISNNILGLIINNNIKINNLCRVLPYIVDNIVLLYDKKIADFLYKKKLYNTLCVFFKKTHEQHNMSWGNIYPKYKKIVSGSEFSKLLFKLNIDIKDANQILNLIKRRWHKKKILFLMTNIIGLSIDINTINV
jgi:hypothetical protein